MLCLQHSPRDCLLRQGGYNGGPPSRSLLRLDTDRRRRSHRVAGTAGQKRPAFSIAVDPAKSLFFGRSVCHGRCRPARRNTTFFLQEQMSLVAVHSPFIFNNLRDRGMLYSEFLGEPHFLFQWPILRKKTAAPLYGLCTQVRPSNACVQLTDKLASSTSGMDSRIDSIQRMLAESNRQGDIMQRRSWWRWPGRSRKGSASAPLWRKRSAFTRPHTR